MSNIQVLDKHTAELIAAGEVVDRPSSVVKELMENAIDAGASTVSVEIENGGIKLIKITDDGSGLLREDVPVAFLRHATSKIRTRDDLEQIGTLGFRGEALASIGAVSKIEMLTCTAGEMAGTRYIIEGGEELLLEDTASPQGTTIIVRDLFYNVPARMKFLKKDVTEANSVAAVADCIALSHPEVSVRFKRDGREVLLSPGDNKLLSCIYSVFGKDFAVGLIPVDYSLGGVHVHGYISKPSSPRSNRTMQHFFINGRYVKTRTAMAALEQAFKGSIMTGKFPSCVLHIDLPLETVDVNVHPAKIEVRFINERPVFDAVYHGVKSALQSGSVPSPMKIPSTVNIEEPISQQTKIPFSNARNDGAAIAHIAAKEMPVQSSEPLHKAASAAAGEERNTSGNDLQIRDGGTIPYNRPLIIPDIICDDPEPPSVQPVPNEESDESASAEFEDSPKVDYIGEAFATYIIAQMGDSIYIIDKHAAHERILYNQLKSSEQSAAQMLLQPISVSLSHEEYAALLPELETLRKAGLEVEDFGSRSVIVRALPMLLEAGDATDIIQEIAGGLAAGRHEIQADKLDWIYHSAACRAAIKAGDTSSSAELQIMAERVLLNDDIRTCPHGRPVCFELSRREMEKQFGRMG
ncbi:MAG: DNA mismatch repair endonuclease MutL [Oscillospiraceae bacterium]|nr:DNA mismatch repair endonuclease MutL [Oscillospiraceae bacterium]MDD4412933.1 DNA mismatch repair endonuclease MutL [Oscillospiraceae bacterium]